MIRADGKSYPWHTTTRTGKPLVLRELTAADSPQLARLFADLSPTATYHRFLSGSRTSAQHYMDSLRCVDTTLCALLAIEGEQVVAVGSLHPDGAGCAEVAITVADDAQGDGIGTLLLQELVAGARAFGLAQLSALVLADNGPMLDVFGQLGLERTVSLPSEAEVDVVVDRSASGDYQERVTARAATAHVAAATRAYEPRTIAIVHDDHHGTLAQLVVRGTRAGGFQGCLETIAWPAPVPRGTDVAVIVTSPLLAEAVLLQCATAGVVGVLWPERLRTRADINQRVIESAGRCGVQLYDLALGAGRGSGDVIGALHGRPGGAPTHLHAADMVLGDERAVATVISGGTLGQGQFAPITEQASRRLQLVAPGAALRPGSLTWRTAPAGELSAALDTVADCPEVSHILVTLDHPRTPADQLRVQKIVSLVQATQRTSQVEVRVTGSVPGPVARRPLVPGRKLRSKDLALAGSD